MKLNTGQHCTLCVFGGLGTIKHLVLSLGILSSLQCISGQCICLLSRTGWLVAAEWLYPHVLFVHPHASVTLGNSLVFLFYVQINYIKILCRNENSMFFHRKQISRIPGYHPLSLRPDQPLPHPS